MRRKVGLLLGALLLFAGGRASQPEAATEVAALVLIDIQYFYFAGGASPLVEPGKAAEQAAKLLVAFRQRRLPVVHVKHLFNPGGNIHDLVRPAEGEMVFEKRAVNCFIGTGLKEYLDSQNIKSIVVCGMQTHMCVEAAVRAGADLGYKVTLIHDACATRNLVWADSVIVPAQLVQASTLATLKSYCNILSTGSFLENFGQ